MLKIHYDSARLKLCADAVFVAIFDVLHVTVHELSKTFLSKYQIQHVSDFDQSADGPL